MPTINVLKGKCLEVFLVCSRLGLSQWDNIGVPRKRHKGKAGQVRLLGPLHRLGSGGRNSLGHMEAHLQISENIMKTNRNGQYPGVKSRQHWCLHNICEIRLPVWSACTEKAAEDHWHQSSHSIHSRGAFWTHRADREKRKMTNQPPIDSTVGLHCAPRWWRWSW